MAAREANGMLTLSGGRRLPPPDERCLNADELPIRETDYDAVDARKRLLFHAAAETGGKRRLTTVTYTFNDGFTVPTLELTQQKRFQVLPCQ